MSDFFEDFGKTISDVASELGKKTNDTLEIQKIKSDIRSLKRANDRDYIDMGKAIYEKFQKSEVMDMDLITFCEAIEKREEEIEKYEAEIARIREDN